MKIVKEEVAFCKDNHFALQTTIMITFIDTDHSEFLVISTAYKKPYLAETLVFRTEDNLGKELDYDKPCLFEWRGINHARAIIECMKFETQTIDYILNKEKDQYGKTLEENMYDLEND